MTKLWAHQQTLKDQIETRRALIVNAGMGTGKTLVALSIINDHPKLRALIVTTKAGIQVWKDEIEKHYPHLNCLALDTGTTKTKAAKVAQDQTGLIIVNYESVWRDELFEQIKKWRPHAVFLDESHRIKAHNSKVSKAMYHLAAQAQAQFRVCLTGTPMPNSPLDIFGQARFVNSELFNKVFDNRRYNLSTNFHLFRDYFARLVPIGTHIYKVIGYKNQEEFYERLGQIMVTVKREDVLDLPDEQHIIRYVELGSKARKAYKELAKEMIADLDTGVITVDNVLVKALRLQQITGGFIKADGSDECTRIDTAKLEMTEDIIATIPATEPVVVFARFTDEIKALKGYLVSKGHTVSLFTGWAKELRFWNFGQTRVLIVQIQAGSEAIDLTLAQYAVYYSSTYSLGQYEQSVARISRPRDNDKRDRTVFYHVIAKGTIDADIQHALENKSDIKREVERGIRRYV